jgi:hypothetical protein
VFSEACSWAVVSDSSSCLLRMTGGWIGADDGL